MRYAAVSAAVILSLILGSAVAGADMRQSGLGDDFTPEPVLLSPTTEEVDLTGKAELEFKWSPHEARRGFRRYYDFRLYKGYDMLERTLIMKKEVDPRADRISIKADTFADGEVYTWSMRQVYDGMQKSRRSTASFKVINKISKE